jgi:hypothetical protein
MPGEEGAGRSLIGGLPRTDLHCINVTAMEKRRDGSLPRRTLSAGSDGSSSTLHAVRSA